MAFSDEFLDELRARIDLGALIGRQVKLARRGREFSGLCPFHKEKTPSFTVSPEKGFYHCFGCGAHGDALRFVTETEGLKFPEAVERLAAQAGLEVPRQSPREQESEAQRKSLHDVLEAATEWYEQQLAGMGGRGAREYLAGRGLSPEVIARFRIGFAPDARDRFKSAMTSRDIKDTTLVETGMLVQADDDRAPYDRFRNRIMFPITDRRGRVVAFGGRALGEARAKYLNSPETPLFHKGQLLYNLAAARQAAHDAGTVILVEGYMDVIALSAAGFHHTVAPLGTALTEQQLEELWRLAPEPVLCFDGDEAGKRAALRAAERALAQIKPGHSLRFVELPLGEDPDSFVGRHGAQAFETLLQGAAPLSALLWRTEYERQPVDTPERRAGLRQRLRKLASAITDPTVKEYYQNHFEEKLAEAFPNRRGGGNQRTYGRREPFFAGKNFKAKGAYRGNQRLPAQKALGQGTQGTGIMLEKALISSILKHPQLLQAVFDDLATLTIDSRELDSLRGELLNSARSGDPLDVAAFRDNLKDSALQRLLDELTSPNGGQFEPLVPPEAPWETVMANWAQAFAMHRLPALKRELVQAQNKLGNELDKLGDDYNEDELRKFLALQEAVRHAETEATKMSE